MICLFNASAKKATTNEEYSIIIQKRIPYLILIIVIGILTAAIATGNEIWGFISNIFFIDNNNMALMDGFYTGLGTALAVMAGLIIIRYKKILKDESLMKKERLKVQDERNQLIAAKAVQSATFTVIICSYFIMLIVGFYSRIVLLCFWGVVMIFFVSYCLSVRYYKKKL